MVVVGGKCPTPCKKEGKLSGRGKCHSGGICPKEEMFYNCYYHINGEIKICTNVQGGMFCTLWK